MMLTIHGLPLAAKYHEIRAIIKGECNLNDFILDNLVPDDDGFKKIRVGVADEIEGAHLMKCLNGFRVGGQTLRVVPVAKTTMDGGINPTFDQRGNYPTRNEYPNQVSNFNRQNPNAAQWAGNQWAPNQQMNQPTGFNYQQQIPNQSYMGQQPTQPQRVLQHEQFQNRMDMQSPMYSGGVQQPSGNKTLMPDPKPTRRPNTRTHVLRSVEIIEQTGNRPAVPGRYPGGQGYEQPKPITIMKDNFQGPNYPGNPQNTPRGHPTHGQAPAWQHPGIQQKPTPFSKDNIPYKSQYEDERKYPDREPSGKITEHHGRGFEKPRGFSPRRSPMNRGISPDRKISPGRIIPRGILDRPRGSDDRHGLDGRPHGGPDGMPHRGPDGRPRGGPNVRARGGPDDMPHRSPDGRPHRGLDGRPHGGPDGMPHRGLDGRPRGGPDDIPHRGPDGRPRGGPDDIPHRGSDGRTRGGPDDISHRGLDGRPRGDLDSMPHRGPEGRPRGGPDGRPHIGHVDAPRSGPDDRLIDGLDRRPHGPDGRHYGRLEGRFHGGPDIRPHTELDDRPLTSLDGKPHGGPDDRRGSPGRRVLLPGRRNSPSHRGVSPSERRFSPSGRRISPGPRRMNERMSPTRRLESPERAARRPTDARHAIRYSPSRRHTDKSDGSRSSSKQVRPAYEPNVQAQNEAMYSGGYRPNPRENIQYPSNRQGDHISPWQDRENPKKIDEDRRDRIPMSRGPDRLPEHGSDLKRQPSPHKSRSPVRRERSPIRDRYRRHSPSPRSPRRSWALEKRRSPGEAPPPPVWPGQNVREEEPYPRPSRPGFHDKNEPSKPTWERSSFHQKNEEPHRDRRPDAFVDEPSRRRDLESREAIHRQSSPGRSFKQEDDRFPKRDQPKFVPIGDFRRQEVPERKHQERDDYREISQRGEPEAHHGDMRRQELPRRPEERIEDYRKRQEIFDKELDDVYKRAVEFAKKTDEMRRHDRMRAPDDRRDERQFRREDELRREPESRFDHRQEDRASRHEDRPTSHHSAEYRRTSREREWKTGVKKWSALDHESKAKRDKASAEISKSLIEKHLNLITSNEMKNYLLEELKSEMLKIIYELFGDKEEVSFIEMVVKCNSKIEGKEGTRLVKDVISRLPAQYRNLKRAAAELPETSAKNFKHTPESNLNDDTSMQVNTYIPDWNMSTGMTSMAFNMQYFPPQPIPPVGDMNSLMLSGLMPPLESIPQDNNYLNSEDKDADGYHLYLCKDDFQPLLFGDVLKEFLVSQIFKMTETSGGWAPNFIFKGLQSPHRYEVITNDVSSKEWLLNLDFSEFTLFKILVYTKEELWYERAAIWLPGHSRYRFEEPFAKLQLQNQKSEELNIGKWKLVKKIVNIKGTRLYVDMPPSSARALEKNKMLLSYELQKVNVLLRAAAVDKNTFDVGLNEQSSLVKESVRSAIANSPMPSLNQNDKNIVKIELKGSKTLTLQQARKIKEMIIYDMFKYLEDGGASKTDFEKYGICSPNYFGVLPANTESKRWLLGRNIGKLNRQPVIVVGGDDNNIRYFTMFVTIPYEQSKLVALVCERLRQSNQGVKGLNFSLWKPKRVIIHPTIRYKSELEVDIDMESVETIIKMNFTLDYLDDDRSSHLADFKPMESKEKLLEKIEKYKSEQMDSYDVANMDIDSHSDNDDANDDDIICLGEVDK